MKIRLGIIVVLACTILGAAVVGTAQAAPHWPAACKKIGCINAHLNALHAENLALAAVNKRQSKTINELITFDNEVSDTFGCFSEYPVSLDVSDYFFLTASGDVPAAWTLFDSCNSSPAIASNRLGTKVSPLARMLSRP